MKFLISISLSVLFFCCSDIASNNKVVDRNLSFKICDSTYIVEKPIWWDSFDLKLIDSLVNTSNSATEYRRSLLNLDRKLRDSLLHASNSATKNKRSFLSSYRSLNSEFFSVHPYNYRISYKLIYYFHREKSESLEEFIRNCDQYVSYEQSAKFKSLLFECEQNYYLALATGQEYFNAGLLDEALVYFNQALKLIDENDTYHDSKYYFKKASEGIQKIQGIHNRSAFLKEHHRFRRTLDSLVYNIKELRTKDRMEGLDRKMNGFMEENFSELGTSNISMLQELSDYDLALNYLVFEDDYAIRKLNNNRMLESIKESFKNYSDDPNFTISKLYKDNPSLHETFRDEWVMIFWAPGLNWSGAAEFERFEYKNSINMIE